MEKEIEEFRKEIGIKLNKQFYPYFSYRKSKNKSKGIIFFIHGYAFDSSYHDFFARLIDDYDYYAVELPGHSITPVRDMKDLSPLSFAKLVVNLINELKLENINLIGHSMGGGIAMLVNKMIPQKIRKLILACPMNSFGTTNLYDFLFHFNAKTQKQIKKLCEIVLYDKSWLKDEQSSFIIDHVIYLNQNFAKYLHALKHKITSPRNIISLASAEKHLKKTDTLLFVAEHDCFINPKTTKFNLLRKDPNLKVVTFEKSGHIPMFEELGKYTNTILEFIKSNV